jgi:hypothetical protein
VANGARFHFAGLEAEGCGGLGGKLQSGTFLEPHRAFAPGVVVGVVIVAFMAGGCGGFPAAREGQSD